MTLLLRLVAGPEVLYEPWNPMIRMYSRLLSFSCSLMSLILYCFQLPTQCIQVVVSLDKVQRVETELIGGRDDETASDTGRSA